MPTAGDLFAQGLGQGEQLYNNVQKNKLVKAETDSKDLANQSALAGLTQQQSVLKALSDPNSVETQQSRALGKAAVEQLRSTGAFKNNQKPLDDLSNSFDQMNGQQIHQTFENSPVLKSITGLAAASDKNSVLAGLAAARMAGVDNQKDSLAAKAADHFDNDQILKKINQQKQQIDLDRHTIKNATTLTPQMLDEVQIGIANAISGGKSSAVSTQDKVELKTAAAKLADFKQRLTSNPQDVDAPQLKQYLVDTLNRLGNAYDQNGFARAQQIYKGKSTAYRHNPAAVQSMQEKVESYRPMAPSSDADVHPQDSAAVQWAKSNPNDPRAAAIMKANGF